MKLIDEAVAAEAGGVVAAGLFLDAQAIKSGDGCGQRLGGGPAQPLAGGGYHGDLVFQSEIHGTLSFSFLLGFL